MVDSVEEDRGQGETSLRSVLFWLESLGCNKFSYGNMVHPNTVSSDLRLPAYI